MSCCFSGQILKTRIRLHKRVQTQSPTGNPITTYVPDKTIWAKWEVLSTGKVMVAQKLDLQIKIKAICRYSSDITPADKIEYLNRLHDIRSLRRLDSNGDSDTTGQWTELLLDGGTPQASVV